jgi:hypothetical protein
MKFKNATEITEFSLFSMQKIYSMIVLFSNYDPDSPKKAIWHLMIYIYMIYMNYLLILLHIINFFCHR